MKICVLHHTECKFNWSMMSVCRLLVIALTYVTYIDAAKPTKVQKPNIVIILADDMGINDVSFHGSNQILTPNIDALAYNGVILNRMYVPNLCTPSRATLLTGKYPIHTGTQHSVIINDEPWGLPLRERLMPEIFRDAGYSTNLIGKWHLGFAKKAFTPTFRGFDYHVGYYSGFISYYDHELFMLGKNYSRGVDFRKNFSINYAANGTYATDYFTDEAIEVVRRHNKKRPLFLVMSHLAVHTGNDDKPMEAPEEEIKKFSHISDPKRRVYAAMVSKLDESVGRLMRALSDKQILNNTIVLFYSDNGAPTEGIYSNAGSNYPFKGQKESPWEGGIRSAAAIWSPLIKQPRLVSHQLIHSIDWLPTLASAAGIKLPSYLQLDGIDLWNTLSNNAPLQSRRFLHVLDDVYGYTSYMRDNFKYVNGTEIFPNYATWLGHIENVPDPRADQYTELVLGSAVSQSIQNQNLSVPAIEAMRRELTYHCSARDGIVPNSGIYKCDPKEAPCLFDIKEDPCEMYNIAAENPILVEELQADIEFYRQTAVSPANRPADPLCNPGLYNDTWTWWEDIQSRSNTRINLITPLFNFTFVLSLMLSRS